jgi:hypothetical protein
MKIKECVKMAKACGLETMSEAVNNIRIHSTNLFVYEEIAAELNELYAELKERGIKPTDKVEDYL